MRILDNPLDEIKNPNNTIAHDNPPKPKTVVPNMVEATVPLSVRTFNWNEIGYVKKRGQLTEKRQWMVGYLPDEPKNQLEVRKIH